MGNEGLWDRQLVKVIKKNIGTFQQIAEWANNNPEGDRRMDMTTKQNAFDEIEKVRGILVDAFNRLTIVQEVVRLLPDPTQPQPEPVPFFLREIDLPGEPKPTIDIPSNPTGRYYAVTKMAYVGPANVISIKVQDRDGNRIDGEDILVGIEDTVELFYLKSGDKGPGLAEIPYDRKRWWIRAGREYSDKLRNATTDIDIEEGDMVNGHVMLEVTFTRFDL